MKLREHEPGSIVWIQETWMKAGECSVTLTLDDLREHKAPRELVRTFERVYGSFWEQKWTLKEQLSWLKSDLRQWLGWLYVEGLLPAWSMRGQNLSGWRVAAADLRQLDLSGSELLNTDCRCVDARETRLTAIVGEGSNWSGANLDSADLYACNLDSANFVEATLEGADCRRGSFRNARFREVSLRYADLGLADLRGAALVDCNLISCNLDGAKRSPEDQPLEGWKVVNGLLEKNGVPMLPT